MFLENLVHVSILIIFLLYCTSVNMVSTLKLWETEGYYNCKCINVQLIFIQAELWTLLTMWVHIEKPWKWRLHTLHFMSFGFYRHFRQRRVIFSIFFWWPVSIDIVTDRLGRFGVKKQDFYCVKALCSRHCSLLDIQCEAW